MRRSSTPRAAAPARLDRAGYSLLEVMIALLLIAIGLMVLQGMSMTAARNLGLAERNTRSAIVASEWLEDGLRQLRRNRRPSNLSCTLANGDRVVRTLDQTVVNVPRLTVTVTPEPRGGPERPYQLSGSVFLPDPVLNTATNAQASCTP